LAGFVIGAFASRLEHVEISDPTSTTRLLALMSFFDREGAPASLLHGYAEDGDGDAGVNHAPAGTEITALADHRDGYY
jgi:hypothetical protein